MHICIIGWYFFENPKVLDDFKKLNKKYPVFIVSHRNSKEAEEILKQSGLDYQIKENIGIEFGAYDWYLKNIWAAVEMIHESSLHKSSLQMSSVLFMHDDTIIDDYAEFDRIAELKYDQAFVFEDEKQSLQNQNWHGRAFYCSGVLLQAIKEEVCNCKLAYDLIDTHNPDAVIPGCGPHSGFWFDRYNCGHISGKPPAGVHHYNTGIYHLLEQLGRMKKKGFDVRHLHFAPGIRLGRRNRFREIGSEELIYQ